MKKTRNYLFTAAGIIIFISGLYLLKTADNPHPFLRALPFVCIGVGGGTFGSGVSNIITNKIYQKNPDIKKQKDINSQDERNILIASRAKAKAYDVVVFVLAVLILVFALMDVAMPPILLLVFTYLFVQVSAVYYRCKYEKEM